jgi:hypothetical protein
MEFIELGINPEGDAISLKSAFDILTNREAVKLYCCSFYNERKGYPRQSMSPLRGLSAALHLEVITISSIRD